MAFHRHCTALVVLVCTNYLLVQSEVIGYHGCTHRLPNWFKFEVECRTDDEVFVLCQAPKCMKTCEDWTHQTKSNCHEVSPYFEPACICKKGMYQNNFKICVPSHKCVKNTGLLKDILKSAHEELGLMDSR